MLFQTPNRPDVKNSMDKKRFIRQDRSQKIIDEKSRLSSDAPEQQSVHQKVHERLYKHAKEKDKERLGKRPEEEKSVNYGNPFDRLRKGELAL